MSTQRQIWKYPLLWEGDDCEITMPPGAEIIYVALQDGKPRMWAIVDPSIPPRDWTTRTFRLAPTGPPGFVWSLHYIGTYQQSSFVWHVLSEEPNGRA